MSRQRPASLQLAKARVRGSVHCFPRAEAESDRAINACHGGEGGEEAGGRAGGQSRHFERAAIAPTQAACLTHCLRCTACVYALCWKYLVPCCALLCMRV